MAETAVEQPPDLAPGSPPQKRKRGAAEPPSPDTRRSKRGTSAAASATPMETAATAFMAVTAAQTDPGLTNAEFSVLPPSSSEQSDAASAALASSTAAAALGSMFPQLNVPAPTEEAFANQTVEGEHPGDASAYSAADLSQAEGLSGLPGSPPSNGIKRPSSGIAVKPAVGSEAWHKMRKDNHKEVERRRRETINEGINELAKIVPGCEKNKGSILQRAVVFITQLKENETQNIEKWTLEKLLTEQAIAELSTSNDKLKAEADRLYRELETWKRVAQNAGLQPHEEKTEASS